MYHYINEIDKFSNFEISNTSDKQIILCRHMPINSLFLVKMSKPFNYQICLTKHLILWVMAGQNMQIAWSDLKIYNNGCYLHIVHLQTCLYVKFYTSLQESSCNY